MLNSFHSLFAGALNLGSPRSWENDSQQTTLIALRHLAAATLIPIGVMFVVIVSAVTLSGILQTGGIQFHANSISLRFNRLSPASNLKNLFSLRTVSLLGKSLFPFAILGILATKRIGREFTIPAFSIQRIEAFGSDVYGLLITTAWLLIAWALIDFLVEWRGRESRLLMSREEMKQEFKETEGSPQTRSRIRGLQRQMRRHRVKADVAKAAVVITNPTHYAVALSFEFATMDAPKVVAKGRNLQAEEIKGEARWANVPIIENPPLARSLYRSVEVGHSIPADLYAAVAAILAYLYRQRVQAETCEREAREAEASANCAAYPLSTANPFSRSTQPANTLSPLSTDVRTGR